MILPIAEYRSERSYVIWMLIADGPLETTPNMSPSWIRLSMSFSKTCRAFGVSPVCMWRSSTNTMKILPATSLAGRDGGRTMPSLNGGGRQQLVVDTPAVYEYEGRNFLGHAVLVDGDFVLRQIGDE